MSKQGTNIRPQRRQTPKRRTQSRHGPKKRSQSSLSPQRRAELLEQFLDSADFNIPGDKADILKLTLNRDSGKWTTESFLKLAEAAAHILIEGKLIDVLQPAAIEKIVSLPFTEGMAMLDDSASYRTVAMRSVAYRITAWAYHPFKKTLPKPSKFVEEVASLPLDFRGKQSALADAKKVWGDAAAETIKQLEIIVQNRHHYNQQEAQEFLKVIGGRNPERFCQMVLRYFERKVRDTKLFGFIPGRGEHSAEFIGFKQSNNRIRYPN
jgi:hypothetical protein